MFKIFHPGAVGASRSYDVIVETADELITEPELIALDLFSRALVLNTDSNSTDASIRIKLSNNNWREIT